MPSTALYTAACANANHMIPSALFSPAPFGGAPAMVLTEIAFQSVMTAASAAAGGWTAEAGSAAVNAALMPRAARMATKPVAGVDGVLTAAGARVEDVGHIRERDAGLDARVVLRLRVVVPRAVAGARDEAGLVVHLRLGDHELAVLEVGDAEVRDGTLRLLRQFLPGHVVVDRVGVVVPDPAEDVGRVLDVDVLAVDRLVVLRLRAGPGRAAHCLDERGHPCRRSVGVVRRHPGRCVVDRAGLPPAPEDEVDHRGHLDVPAEVRHV